MSQEDEEAPREAIWYAATAIKSGYRQIPRKRRGSDYLNNYTEASTYEAGADTCRITMIFAEEPDAFNPSKTLKQVVRANGILVRQGDTWCDAKLVLTLADESSWTLHHYTIDGKVVADIEQMSAKSH